MTEQSYLQLKDALLPVCQRAAAAIVEYYHSGEEPQITMKADASPVTQADHHSHEILLEGLRAITPQWPVLSEEAALPPYNERAKWQRYWLVDPLDGTREFIQRTGEFTINIALVEAGVAVMGMVAVPLKSEFYWGVVGSGAGKFSNQGEHPIAVAPITPDRVRVFASSRHRGKALTACIEKLQAHFETVEFLRAGSALKFCLLAEGCGDFYPRFSPCSEWDTAAGQAVLEAAGGAVVDLAFRPLRYNRGASVSSPHFYALGGGTDWKALIG